MPMAITTSITTLWLYGSIMCKLTFYLQGVAVGASVFTITAMSIDRYLAIRYPMAFRKIFNRKTTILVILILWIVALVIFLPLLWVRRTEGVEELRHDLVWCTENWGGYTRLRTWYGLACFIIVYLIPGVVVVLAYSLMGRSLCAAPPFSGQCSKSTQGYRLVRERRRVARILLLLALLFALCWLPYNVLYLIIDLEILSQENNQTAVYVLPFTLFLGHANSAVNPVIYCFMTKNLRTTIKELVFRSRLTLARRHHQRHKIRSPDQQDWPTGRAGPIGAAGGRCLLLRGPNGTGQATRRFSTGMPPVRSTRVETHFTTSGTPATGPNASTRSTRVDLYVQHENQYL